MKNLIMKILKPFHAEIHGTGLWVWFESMDRGKRKQLQIQIAG